MVEAAGSKERLGVALRGPRWNWHLSNPVQRIQRPVRESCALNSKIIENASATGTFAR